MGIRERQQEGAYWDKVRKAGLLTAPSPYGRMTPEQAAQQAQMLQEEQYKQFGVPNSSYPSTANEAGRAAGALLKLPYQGAKETWNMLGRGPTASEVAGKVLVDPVMNFGRGLVGKDAVYDSPDLVGAFEERDPPTATEAIDPNYENTANTEGSQGGGSTRRRQEDIQRRKIEDDAKAAAAAQMEKDGISDEEQNIFMKGLDNFTGKFDMLALGATLMAGNDGKRSLGENIGKSLLAARKTRINDNLREDRLSLAERDTKAREVASGSAWLRANAYAAYQQGQGNELTPREVTVGKGLADSIIDKDRRDDPRYPEAAHKMALAYKMFESDPMVAERTKDMSPLEKHEMISKLVKNRSTSPELGWIEKGWFSNSMR